MSWILCGDSKVNQQIPLLLRPITLFWDAAHQYDLHHTKKGPQRKAFLSQQKEVNDEDEYGIEEEQFSTDPEPEEPSPYSVYQSSFHPNMPQKSYLPPKTGKHFLIAPNK